MVEGTEQLDGRQNGANLAIVQVSDRGEIDLQTQGDDEWDLVYEKNIAFNEKK